MAGLTALSQPAVEQGSFSVIQLVSGLAVKVPVTLNAIGSGDKATFHFNRQVSKTVVNFGLLNLRHQLIGNTRGCTIDFQGPRIHGWILLVLAITVVYNRKY